MNESNSSSEGGKDRAFESCSSSSPYSASERAFYGCLGASLSAYIAAVNLAILAVFLRDRSVRRVPGHVFIVGLMVSSDVLIGLLALPGYLVQTLCGGWPLPKWCCDLWITVDYLSTNVSMLSVTTVAFDRFLATNFVFTHKRWMHRANQIRLCVGVWAFTAARCVITFPVWAIASGFRARESYGKCGHPIYNDMVAGLVQRTVALYIPVILLVFFYGAVVFRILKSSSTFGASVVVLRGTSGMRGRNIRSQRPTPSQIEAEADEEELTPLPTTQAYSAAVAGRNNSETGERKQQGMALLHPTGSSSPRLTLRPPSYSGDLRSLGGSCQTLSAAGASSTPGKGAGRRGGIGGTLASRLSKSFRMVSCVLAAFLLANMPWQVIENMIATGATSVRKTDAIYVLFWILSYMNALLNPLFYCFMNQEYKKAMLRFIRCRPAIGGAGGGGGTGTGGRRGGVASGVALGDASSRRPSAAVPAASGGGGSGGSQLAGAVRASAPNALDVSSAAAVASADLPEIVALATPPRRSTLCVYEPDYLRFSK